MNQSKYIFISTLIASLLVLVGCTTQTATNTNANVTNANTTVEVVANTNEIVVNDNTNTNTNAEQLSAVDTSDWLTYTNEEYGFSFRYPEDWTVDVFDEGDEGGMGTSLGDIVLSSNVCRAQSNELTLGSIDEIKSDTLNSSNKSLVDIDINGIEGIKYYDVVNENGYMGYIYVYKISQSEISFNLIDNPDDKNCRSLFEAIMSSMVTNS